MTVVREFLGGGGSQFPEARKIKESLNCQCGCNIYLEFRVSKMKLER